MKKTIIALMALAGVSQVMAASISSDDYVYNGSGTSLSLDADILPSTGSFAISYELVGLTLTDVVESGGPTLLSLKLKDINNKEESITVGYSFAAGFSLQAGTNFDVSFNHARVDESVTFLLQYDSTNSTLSFSYYMEYDSPVNPCDLTKLTSVALNSDNIFERGIASGSFAVTIPSGSIDNIYTWQGEVTANDIMTASKQEPSPSIPEPATATLSLLALAGLAARRRRR